MDPPPRFAPMVWPAKNEAPAHSPAMMITPKQMPITPAWLSVANAAAEEAPAEPAFVHDNIVFADAHPNG